MIDTSASKAAGYFAAAQKLAEMLVVKMGDKDRLALWTANIDVHDLSRGFKNKGELSDAVNALSKEYPSGAVNLKKCVGTAVEKFAEGGNSRQRVIVFFGDGQSTAGPLDGNARAALASELVKREIAFFAVPLGNRFDSSNLHGLVGATGGKVVRVEEKDKAEDTVARLKTAVAVPILYPQSVQLPAEMTDATPTKLPPLRGDAPTLVVGKLTKIGTTFDYTVVGTVAGKEVRVATSLPMPPAEVENFFLVNIANQWREHKDRPALLQADRTLAFAYDQNQMAGSKLIADADWAMEEKKYEHAYRLYQQALKVDPHNGEAKAGVNLVEQLRDGKVTPEQLRENIKPRDGENVVRIVKDMKARGKDIKGEKDQVHVRFEKVNRADVLLGQEDGKQPVLAPEIKEEKRDILKEQEARQAVADQQAGEGRPRRDPPGESTRQARAGRRPRTGQADARRHPHRPGPDRQDTDQPLRAARSHAGERRSRRRRRQARTGRRREPGRSG